MGSRLLWVVLRFAAAYALLLALAYAVPLYAWIESLHTELVELSLGPLTETGDVRELSVQPKGDAWEYRYRVFRDGAQRELSAPMHPHGFILLLFLALVVATPGLGPRARSAALLGGGVLCVALGAGMLMSDVQRLEERAFERGPYPAIVSLLDGLHRTAAGALIPLVVWGFLASPLLRSRR